MRAHQRMTELLDPATSRMRDAGASLGSLAMMVEEGRGRMTKHGSHPLVRVMLASVAIVGCVSSETGGSEEAAGESAALVAETAGSERERDVEESLLSGTRWRLVEFQSMDDSVGVVAPEDPSRYTMSLNADGSVDMVLDCNRANGSWSADPVQDGQSGSFAFGPLAGTRALCPPPRMDERITRDAEWVRSFLLHDGNLYLSLMADGGIYAWEPMGEPGSGVSASSDADAGIEEAILAAEPDYTREMVEIGGIEGRYVLSLIDLDDDGTAEVFVYLLGSIFCGTGGCTLLLFDETDGGYELVNRFPISRTPVIVSVEGSHGWKDIFRFEAGGGAASSFVRHVFDGERYMERERREGEDLPTGTEIFSTDVSYAEGTPLPPGG